MKNLYFKNNNNYIFGTYVNENEIKDILNKIEYDRVLKQFKYKVIENNHTWQVYFDTVVIDGKDFMTI